MDCLDLPIPSIYSLADVGHLTFQHLVLKTTKNNTFCSQDFPPPVTQWLPKHWGIFNFFQHYQQSTAIKRYWLDIKTGCETEAAVSLLFINKFCQQWSAQCLSSGSELGLELNSSETWLHVKNPLQLFCFLTLWYSYVSVFGMMSKQILA